MKIILMIFASFFICINVYAGPSEKADKTLIELSEEVGFDFYSLAKDLSAGKGAENILLNIKELAAGGIRDILKVMKMAYFPILIFGILKFITPENKGASEGAFLVCFFIVMGIITGVFKNITQVVYDTAATIELINKALIPVLFSLLAATGSLTQATVSQPVVIWVSQIITHLIFKLLIPSVTIGYALVLTDSINRTGGMKYMGEMILKISKKALLFLMIIFMGVLSVQRLMGNAVDSVVLRSTRFAVSNLIPVVGGAISEGVEALGASLKVIRNSTGIAGMAGLFVLIIPPLVKIYLTALIMHLFAALSLSVSDKRFGEVLAFSGEIISFLGAVILSMAFVFIITAGIISGSRVI